MNPLITIHTHIYTYGQFRVFTKANKYISGTWEEVHILHSILIS